MKSGLSTTLRKLRLRVFMSQREFSRTLNIDRSTYNAWETGRRIPLPESIKVVVDWYTAKGIDTTELVIEYEKAKA